MQPNETDWPKPDEAWLRLFGNPADAARARGVLQSLPMFAKLSEQTLTEFISGCETAFWQPGEVLMRQGSTPKGLLILLAGTVKIIREADGRQTHLASLTAPAVLGEMGAFDGKPRSASVVAESTCHGLLVPRSWLDRFLRTFPQAGCALLMGTLIEMCTRIRSANEKTSGLVAELLRLQGE